VKEVAAKSLLLTKVEAAGDFYLEVQEVLDHKPYPTLEGSRSSSISHRTKAQNRRHQSRRDRRSWLLKQLDDEKFFDRVSG